MLPDLGQHQESYCFDRLERVIRKQQPVAQYLKLADEQHMNTNYNPLKFVF